MSVMRAKMMVTKVDQLNPPEAIPAMMRLEMTAVTDRPFDADGQSDDNTYARWTPSGTLSLSVTNPNLFDKFKYGQKFYLDFIFDGEW